MQAGVMFPKKKKTRILICKSSTLSYGSARFFLQQIIAELEKREVAVEFFSVQEDYSNIDGLECYAEQAFDAVLDVNGRLPLMVMEDGSHLIQHIHAPYFNYLVDHPMHLHPLLQCTAQNYHILCLDEFHRQYIRQYYPWRKECYVLPLAASVPEHFIPFPERSRPIFFPGTYVPLVEYTAKLQEIFSACDSGCAALAEEYARQYFADPEIPDLPVWYQSRCPGAALGAQELHIQCRYIDRYLREVIRHRVIEAVLAQGYSIHVTGAHWEYYDGKYADRLIIHPSCDYASMLEQMGDSRIVLNVQPLFRDAPHDRILCGMAGGAAVLTDSCAFLENNLTAGQHYLRYDVRKPDRSLRNLRKYLDSPEWLEKIAGAGRQKILGRYQWSNWVDRFLEIIDNKKRKR